ncbi:replication initiation protein RepC [Agrobacterium pusense]|uniref:replication initiation protein RepC n=1 Tax=Agrobacterium pusense TaxID=648995 RepID=UPI0032DB5486
MSSTRRSWCERCLAPSPHDLRTSPLLSRAALNRVGHITSPGGYLRDLTRKAERGEFNLGPTIMASMRANAGADMKTA